MKPHPKVAVITLLGVIATTISAVSKGTVDPATIGTAVLTLVQFVAGYLTPAQLKAVEKVEAKVVEVVVPTHVVQVPVSIAPGAVDVPIVLRAVAAATGTATRDAADAQIAHQIGRLTN